jgi:1-deoxy-D-xylulose-5-phosphate reductoisomerase
VIAGPDALTRLVDRVEADCVLCAVVGARGLPATVRAVERGRRVALANKEALVVAGSLLIPMARRSGATLIPVDSEHSAIFQAMQAGRHDEVRCIYLTASGGPFRTWDAQQMENVTLEQAMRHPTWTMGPKITVDSATMMNKALEIVEARWLFDLSPDRIRVVVHPESIVHSMVEFCDGSVVAQLGTPDMRTPIQYALTFPHRRPGPSRPLDLVQMRSLCFEAPDPERFPALRLGGEVARRGGTSGAVLNAANEACVELFRAGAIGFRDIARLVERALDDHEFHPAPTMDDLMKADRWARHEVTRCTTC